VRQRQGLAPAEVRDSALAPVRVHWGLRLKALAGASITDPIAQGHRI
jgi:hypothetical protein